MFSYLATYIARNSSSSG